MIALLLKLRSVFCHYRGNRFVSLSVFLFGYFCVLIVPVPVDEKRVIKQFTS